MAFKLSQKATQEEHEKLRALQNRLSFSPQVKLNLNPPVKAPFCKPGEFESKRVPFAQLPTDSSLNIRSEVVEKAELLRQNMKKPTLGGKLYSKRPNMTPDSKSPTKKTHFNIKPVLEENFENQQNYETTSSFLPDQSLAQESQKTLIRMMGGFELLSDAYSQVYPDQAYNPQEESMQEFIDRVKDTESFSQFMREQNENEKKHTPPRLEVPYSQRETSSNSKAQQNSQEKLQTTKTLQKASEKLLAQNPEAKKREQLFDMSAYEKPELKLGQKRALPFASFSKKQERKQEKPASIKHKILSRKELSSQGFVKQNLKKIGFEEFTEGEEGGEVFDFQFGFSKKPLFQLDPLTIHRDQNGSDSQFEEEEQFDDDHESDNEMVESGFQTCQQDLQELVAQLNCRRTSPVRALLNSGSVFAHFCN